MEASSASEMIPQCVNKVFDLELLREKILEYVIYNEDYLRSQYACYCRLVNKSWLQSISRILRGSTQSLFRFSIEDNYSSEKDMYEDELPVDNFLELVVSSNPLNESVLPFSLTTANCFFDEKNCQRFVDIFTHCGRGLVLLSLYIFNELDSIKLGNHTFLPKLQSLAVEFWGAEEPTCRNADVSIIQSILDASPQLQSFVLTEHGNYFDLPDNLSSLVLPPTITHVDLDCMLDEDQLQFLVKSSLPNIMSLELTIPTNPLQDEIITRILENVRKTLETLSVCHLVNLYSEKGPTMFRLPVMKELKKLYIHTPFLELEDNSFCLERHVPNVSHMTLIWQPAQMFRKWTERSHFESVSSLTVMLGNENYTESYDELLYDPQVANFDVDTMKCLRNAFPNLVKLDIDFYAAPLNTVFVIMMELRKLKWLSISIRDGLKEIESSDVFDALFLGIPKDTVAALRGSPDLFEDLLEGKKNDSIRNLTDLETLCMYSYSRSEFSFISDLSFDFAFLKMPRLTKLRFGGDFFVTTDMTEKWVEEGRTIKYRGSFWIC